MVKCIRVPKSEGNRARMTLKEADALDIDHRIMSDGDHLLIPITCGTFDGYEMTDADLPAIEHAITDYRLLLPESVRDILPNSYDNIGDVTIIKIPDELMYLKHEIGDALVKASKNTRCVLMDSGVKGELRIRDLELIAGEGPSETRHRESGVTIMTDPAKVYYNPRLATERERIAGMVKDGETVIDMFAGVAPFPLTICRYAHPKVVYSIDLNHDAVEYARRNVELNRFDNIVVLEGDAREVVKGLPMADRILMNLPQIAREFLPDALMKVKKGGMVHMHSIMERDTAEDTCRSLMDEMCRMGLECSLSELRELKTYSPTASVYVLDIIRG